MPESCFVLILLSSRDPRHCPLLLCTLCFVAQKCLPWQAVSRWTGKRRET